MDSRFDQKIATLQASCRAFNARDYSAVAALFHPEAEVELTILAPAGTSYSGRAGVRSLIEAVHARYPGLEARIVSTKELGRGVLASVVYSTGDPDGMRQAAAALYEFDGDAIRRARTFATEEEARAAAEDGRGPAIAADPVLTPREREIFRMLALGFNAPEIADRLFLSPATVRTHVQNGVARMGAKTRVQAVAMALAQGEISL